MLAKICNLVALLYSVATSSGAMVFILGKEVE